MNLAKEAGYIYYLSKGLLKVNKKLHNLSKRAEKHKTKHERAAENKKHKHKQKHDKVLDKIKALKKTHNRLIKKISHHYVNFRHSLQKEHKF